MSYSNHSNSLYGDKKFGMKFYNSKVKFFATLVSKLCVLNALRKI